MPKWLKALANPNTAQLDIAIGLLFVVGAIGLVRGYNAHIASDALVAEHLNASKVTSHNWQQKYDSVSRNAIAVSIAALQYRDSVLKHTRKLVAKIDTVLLEAPPVAVVHGDTITIDDTAYVVPTHVAEWVDMAAHTMVTMDNLLAVTELTLKVQVPIVLARYDSALAVQVRAHLLADSTIASLQRQADLAEQEAHHSLPRRVFDRFREGAEDLAIYAALYGLGRATRIIK